MTLVFALFASGFSGLAQAQEIKKENKQITEEDRQVAELAEQLKFIFEEASIKDKSGQVVDIDINMIENKYGKTEELELLRQEIQKSKTNSMYEDPFKQETPAVDRCIERKIIANYREVLNVAFISTIIVNIKNKEYEYAAKKMLKLGVKGSLPGLIAQLSWYLGSCIWEEEGWNGK